MKSVRDGQLSTSTGTLHSDFIILAAGSRLNPVSVEGIEKSGVFVLDGPGKYAEVGRLASSTDALVVCGEGERALQVADRLSTRGVKVKLMISHWKYGRPSAYIESVIRRAAKDSGVAILEGRPLRALGVEKLEALAFDGGVIGCDRLVLVPGRRPALPSTTALLGRRGGVLVDGFLRSNVHSIFAAGASAEVEGGLPPHAPLDEEPGTSGRIAGGNAAGEDQQVKLARVSEVLAFGLRWSRAGILIPDSHSGAFNLGITSLGWETSACTLVFHKRSRKLMGIETISDIGDRTGYEGPLVSDGRTLESLAYGGSTDITLVSETALIGLRPWSVS